MSRIESNLTTNNFEHVKTTLLDFIGTNQLLPWLKELSFQWFGIEPIGYATMNKLGELETHMFVETTAFQNVEQEGLIYERSLPCESLTVGRSITYERLQILNKAIKYHHITLKMGERTKEIPKMTKREQQIVDQLLLGKTNAEIGIQLDISPRTAEKHCQNIFNKFGIKNRYALVSAFGDLQNEKTE